LIEKTNRDLGARYAPNQEVIFLTYLRLEFLHKKKKILKIYTTVISCFKSFIRMMQSLSGNRG